MDNDADPGELKSSDRTNLDRELLDTERLCPGYVDIRSKACVKDGATRSFSSPFVEQTGGEKVLK
jgi:hypothetical protein